jgi:hypothetical protein
MMFKRGQDPKEALKIGKYHDALKIEHMIITGDVGWEKNTREVDYKLEGIDLKNYLKALEEGKGFIRTEKADNILQEYMRAVFYGTQILREGKQSLKEEDLIVWLRQLSVSIVEDDLHLHMKSSIEKIQGKNVLYERDAYYIPKAYYNDEI